MPPLTLGRRTGTDGFRAIIATWLREGADLTRRSADSSPFTDSSVRTLEDTAVYVETLDLDDQSQRALYHLSAIAGWGTDSAPWRPGEDAATFRANLGFGPERPTPAEALSELVAVCVDDFTRELAEASAKSAARIEALESELADLGALRDRATRAEAARDQAAAEAESNLAELRRVKEEAEHLRTVAARFEQQQTKPKPKPKPKAGAKKKQPAAAA